MNEGEEGENGGFDHFGDEERYPRNNDVGSNPTIVPDVWEIG